MKRIASVFMILVLSMGISMSYGQDLKKFMKKRKEAAKETTGERIGEEADKKIAKEINKGFDRLFGSDEEEESQDSNSQRSSASSGSASSSASSASMNALMGAMGMGADVNVRDAYSFDSYVEMTIVNYESDGGKEESVIYETYLDSESFDYGMQFRDPEQQGTSLMIFDTENSLMLTLVESDGEKTGFAVGFDSGEISSMAEEYAEEAAEAEEEDADYGADDVDTNPYNFKKTGKTKTISGYKCDEYQYEDEESVVSIWTTDELDKRVGKSHLTNNNFAGMFFYAYYMKGFVMEYDILDKSDDDRMVMTVTDIDLGRRTTFNTGEYNIMSMGAAMEEAEASPEE